MQVEVSYRLPAIAAGVSDDAEAAGQMLLAHGGGLVQKMAEELGGSFGNVREVPFGNDEQVGRRCGGDVGEDEGEIVFEEDFSRDLMSRDATE